MKTNIYKNILLLQSEVCQGFFKPPTISTYYYENRTL